MIWVFFKMNFCLSKTTSVYRRSVVTPRWKVRLHISLRSLWKYSNNVQNSFHLPPFFTRFGHRKTVNMDREWPTSLLFNIFFPLSLQHRTEISEISCNQWCTETKIVGGNNILWICANIEQFALSVRFPIFLRKNPP